EFLGRLDFQVKIRGFRIELGEIETRLLENPGINDVVVMANEDKSGDKYLCAYYVSPDEQDIEALKSRLSQKLPGYMIPTHFVRLEKMPLTANGKVDRKNLSVPEAFNREGNRRYTAPGNDKEKILSRIWSAVLNIDKIGIHDNFFQLGGHSLKAVSIVSRINQEFGVRLPISIIFEESTIAQLAQV
ncbi:MAG: non-ribosomal peptide synthetase, partial [bacterium]|nr:non-ribosomal peptide synthetase [bacterium]